MTRAKRGVLLWALVLAGCGFSDAEPAPVVGSSDTTARSEDRPIAEPVASASPAEEAENDGVAWGPPADEQALRQGRGRPPAGPSTRGSEGSVGGYAGEADDAFGNEAAAAPRSRRAQPLAPAPHAPPQRILGITPGGGGMGAAPRTAMAQPALPQNAVLASSFVAGGGAQARLEDLLDRGVMVDGHNVRLQAFDELGRLPYAVPSTEAVSLHAELERGRLHTGGERVHLQIVLMARRGEAPPRPRMDVRLVFDRSGSMMGDKWTHGIAAAHQLVDRLEPGDTFGLISYSDEASIDLPPARVGNRRAAHAAINALTPGGGTNIEAALRAAESVAPTRRGMSDVLLTVLVSDGVANVGQTNAQELGSIARGSFDAHGVLTTSVGLGTDFDEETMLSIAREGSGSYHFVRRSADISEILQDELEERAQAVAQALRLRIELGEGVVARRVYGSTVLDQQQEAAVRRTEIATDRRLARELGITRDRQEDEDRGLRIHLPSFRRADQHVVLMELDVPAGTSASRIARITLDYKDLLSQENRTARVDVTAERTSDREAVVASTRRTVKRTVLAFTAGDALQGASQALARGDLAGARQLLAERQRVLIAGADLWHDESLRHDAELLSRYDRVLGGAWNSWDGQSQHTMVLAMNFYGDQRMR